MSEKSMDELFPPGVIGFPVTPFNHDHSLDLSGFARNLEIILSNPFTAFVAAGGTGELYSLARDEYLSVIRSAVEETDGTMPIIAGVGYGSHIAQIMASEAEKIGASAILVLPPYYSNACFDGVLAYLQGIGRATSLPLILYTRDWLQINPEEAERLADEVPTLQGWKDGQGELRALQRIRARVGDRFTWIGGVGDDHVSGYYGIGLRRFTSSISCVAPKLSLALHKVATAREDAELAELTDRFVLPLYNLRTRRKGYEVSSMKALLELRGLAGGPCRPPLVDVNETEREELRQILSSWKEFL
jgi:5-dehydro-4-deoxyglucarate dehydratase